MVALWSHIRWSRVQHLGHWGLQFHNTVELNETKVTHACIHGEPDDFVCLRIKFHLLLFSHSRITGTSDRGVLFESLFRSLAIFERNLLVPSFIPCWWRWHVPLKCQCQSVKTEDYHRISACGKIMDTCIGAWHISPDLQLPDALVVIVNNSRLRNVKWQFHCIVCSSVQ